jgi:pSer/pThr/pTyr-binding forkhead associated (FHA) protein
MKVATMTGQFGLRCLDQRLPGMMNLEKKKILIGSGDNCDLKISDRSISSYHAFVCLTSEGFIIKDLCSEAGVFINGKRIQESFVNAGDVITLGTLSFAVENHEDMEAPVFDPDEAIASVSPIRSFVELPPKEGLVFIDGEYCDIAFDDSQFKPLSEMPSLHTLGDYIELEESIEPLDIVHKVQDKRLEVVSYVNGLMMDVSYLDLKNGDYHLSPVKKSKTDIVFHTLTKTKLFTIERGDLRFYPSEGITPSMPW